MQKSKNKIIVLILTLLILVILLILLFSINKQEEKTNVEQPSNQEEIEKYIPQKIIIKDIDGKGMNYEFEYNNEIFKATYTPDHWKIYDSYKITILVDMQNICKELININPIHGRDMVSYRTPEDMAYEWSQHNIAYLLLPNDNSWKDNAKDVDFDPNDQGKTIAEIYEDRTGQKFDLSNLTN